MHPHIIALPTGEAIAASTIVAVRKGDRTTTSPGTEYAKEIPDRVIIDYRIAQGRDGWANTVILYTDTPEERDTLAASIIEQWKSATP